MSVLTKSRRYDIKNYNQSERDQLIQHFVSKTQPQRRIFLGKTEGFIDRAERKINELMLKAYNKGAQLFYVPGDTMPVEIQKEVFDKEQNKKVKVGTGFFEDKPRPHLVKQMYFFN